MKLHKYIFLFLSLTFLSTIAQAQNNKRIEIREAGFGDIDEEKYPGARILTRSEAGQVHVFHDGIDMWCDQAIIYSKDDFIEAYGNVKMKQGDTINMNANYAEYSGKTQLAFASGDVVLTEPSSKLTTDKLYFDRVKQQAFYKTGGTVVRDSSGTITSTIGRYYMNQKKYQFVNKVKLVNPDYVLKTEQLDYYTTTAHAYMFGPSTITDASSKIYSERGFYDTKNKVGHFVRKSRIDYDNRIIEGDSLFFNRLKNFASATNNITITDTINNSIIKGHYAEVFKDKDSVFITKRALAITLQENDSIFMHADTLMVTGKPEHRITRAFRNAKIFKSDMSGKADSIHANHKTGLTKLINLSRLSSNDAFATKRKPILWNFANQMTGDTIHLKSNPKTEKLDSLIVFENAFLISKDTISEDGYNQISGKRLYGLFNENNKLKQVDVIKNAESIYYARNDENELIGIEKSKSASIVMYFEANEIVELRKNNQVEGKLYPETEFPKNARKLRGFDWREDERPTSVESLFEDDPPLNLPVIKGLEAYVPQEEFFDEALIERVQKAEKEETKPKTEAKKPQLKAEQKPSKAARRLPQKMRDSLMNSDSGRKPILKKNE
ncbi:OstA-like protein [Lacinutrix salivirga]